MAQTRRMGKRNQRAERPKAPRFSHCYVPFLVGIAFPLLKLTRRGSRRISWLFFKMRPAGNAEKQPTGRTLCEFTNELAIQMMETGR
jgi:hypothetical protein